MLKRKNNNRFAIICVSIVIVIAGWMIYNKEFLPNIQNTQTNPQKVCEGSGVTVNVNDECPPHWCGDVSCFLESYKGYTESCSSCPQDCGQCPTDKLSNFNILSISCNSVLPKLSFSIKNSRYDVVRVNEVWINIPKVGRNNTMSRYPDYEINRGETYSADFPLECSSGDYFQIRIRYIESGDLKEDFGSRYDIP